MAIEKINIFTNELAIKWANQEESFIQNVCLRDACPCAFCVGETDVFGNKYIGEGIQKSDDAYKINKIEYVGHYALQIFWRDNHNSGIYTFELLKKLANG